MTKLSKSGTLDKEQEARDREFLNRLNPSLHFSTGSDVCVAGKGKGRILSRGPHVSQSGQWLLIQWEDGSMDLIKPFALNR